MPTKGKRLSINLSPPMLDALAEIGGQESTALRALALFGLRALGKELHWYQADIARILVDPDLAPALKQQFLNEFDAGVQQGCSRGAARSLKPSQLLDMADDEVDDAASDDDDPFAGEGFAFDGE